MKTITVPVRASIGISIAFDGRHLYYTNYQDTNLYVIDTDGQLVRTLEVGVNLGALSWDAGRGKLWAGTLDRSQRVFLVDPVTGDLTFQFNAPGNFHDGLAYDASDDTLWFSEDAVTTVHHLTTSGQVIKIFEVPFPNSGIAVGGPALYMGSAGNGRIYRVDKLSGQVLEVFASPGGRDEDLECDSVTFAPREVMWSKDAYNNTLMAFEVTPGTCQFGLIPSPQGQLQLAMAEALQPQEPVRPQVLVTHREQRAASYTVLVTLSRDSQIVASRSLELAFSWAGQRRIALDLGPVSPGSYVLEARLREGDTTLSEDARSFTVGRDQARLHDALGPLRDAAYGELDEGRDIAAGVMGEAVGNLSGEAVNAAVDTLGEFVGKVPVVARYLNLVPREIEEVSGEIAGNILDVGEYIDRAASGPVTGLVRERLDANTYNERRASIDAAEAELLRSVAGRPFTFTPALEADLLRRQELIRSQNETVGVLGIQASLQAPFLRHASLVDQRTQFDWIKRDLLDWIGKAAQFVAITLLVTLLVALVVVALPTSVLPPALIAVLIAVGKLIVVLAPFLFKFYGILKSTKLAGALVLMIFAMVISTGAQLIVSPKVVAEHAAAMNRARNSVGPAGADTPAPEVRAAAAGHDVTLQLTAAGPGEGLQTQLFRADGVLLDIVDHNASNQAATASSYTLPAGEYWAVGVSQAGSRPRGAQTRFAVAGAMAELSVQLSRNRLALGDVLTATITITNSGAGALAEAGLTVSTLRGEGLQVWPVSLGPGEHLVHQYVFTPQQAGGAVLRAALVDRYGPVSQVDWPFSVGDQGAVAVNYTPSPTYQPGGPVTWQATAENVGPRPATVTLSLATATQGASFTLAYAQSYTLTLSPGERRPVALTALDRAEPGAYSTLLRVNDEPYRSDSFLVAAEGTLFVLPRAPSEPLVAGTPVTVSVEVQRETFAPVDADVALEVVTPQGAVVPVALTRLGAGEYAGSFTPATPGTYTARAAASKARFRSARAEENVIVGQRSTLGADVQGALSLGATTPITVSVYNELLLPVADVTVTISSTGGLVAARTDRRGVATLRVTPESRADVRIVAEKAGFDTATLTLPVAPASDSRPPELYLVVPESTNQPSVAVQGRAEVGAALTVNGTAVPLSGSGTFSTTVNLAPGSNTILGSASDSAGNTTTVTRTVELDTTPPALGVTKPLSPLAFAGLVVEVQGTTDPDAAVTVNGQLIQVQQGVFRAQVPTLLPGRNLITVEASDRAGNTRIVTLEVSRPAPMKLYLPVVRR